MFHIHNMCEDTLLLLKNFIIYYLSCISRRRILAFMFKFCKHFSVIHKFIYIFFKHFGRKVLIFYKYRTSRICYSLGIVILMVARHIRRRHEHGGSAADRYFRHR